MAKMRLKIFVGINKVFAFGQERIVGPSDTAGVSAGIEKN
jgi:hypothetical protein